MKLSEIIKFLNAEANFSSDVEIKHLAKIEEASDGDITFLSNPKYNKFLITTNASAILVDKNIEYKELKERKSPIILVRVDNPYIAFLRLIDIFYPSPTPLAKGIHNTAVISPDARIGENVAIGANVFIGNRCIIGKNTQIWHNTVLFDDVIVGDNTVIYSNVTVREQCRIGKNVIIHSGTVVGSDGFGFAPKPDGTYEKIPQRGIVVIEDDVEIGSNCSIDRATLGETKICRGAKLDNLIQIAHNVIVGENTVIAAQTGISGSTKIGKNCVLAGQVGLVGHIMIADRTTIAAQSGISKSITEEGKTYFGYPATEISEMRRIVAANRQLPKLLIEIEELKRKIKYLEDKLSEENK